MMTAVDLVAWFLVFTRNGITPMALTWDLKINFLRPAHGADLIVRARQTKFGKFVSRIDRPAYGRRPRPSRRPRNNHLRAPGRGLDQIPLRSRAAALTTDWRQRR